VGPPVGAKVRIAHLDTGYATHDALPQFLREDLARNFVEPDNPLSAIDPGTDGFLKNPGHGTGTMSILAGTRMPQGAWNDFLGGAPHAEVAPVRIGDSVVHFYSSSMAQGLDWALFIGAQVVSISMGGVPSKAWAEAVNRLYDAGVAIFAAAGNNFGGLPTTSTVYPARFKRVTAVCGAAADKTPYYKGLLYLGMQGNFGPSAKMKTAIAAYTPNIPWAEWGCPETIDLDGGGTSSATPQAAAAAALWIQQHAAALQAGPFAAQPWRRVEAVRHALFSTADKTAPESSTYFGNGLLRAQDALVVAPDSTRAQTPLDSVSWPWIRLLFGIGAAGTSAREEMLELEMIQLLTTFDELAGDEKELMDADAQPTNAETKKIVRRLMKSSLASATLREEISNLGL
jgi:subtilisin family serine protease